ncbi:MAG: amino acid adenylation domain-containing protein [Nitrospirae bacterium]|nr:amino acid adenylation domain-containing protein [Nitrospirota bacterium]
MVNNMGEMVLKIDENNMLKSGLRVEKTGSRADQAGLLVDKTGSCADKPGLHVIKAGFALHRMFERSVEIYGDNVALECQNELLTYNELNLRANKLARYLCAIGVARGNRVGILLERSVSTYVSILAVVKAGAAYVPLDVSYPKDRIEYIAEDADLVKIITSGHLLPLLGNADSLAVVLTGNPVHIAADSATTPHIPGTFYIQSNPESNEFGSNVSDDDLCYVIYTSGSTGRPKGVAVEHGSICNQVAVCKDIYNIQPTDRVYQGFSISFDFSFDEIWGAWLAGATLVSCPGGVNLIGSELANFLIEKKITVLCSVPTILSTIDVDIPSVRLLNVGGETFTQELAARWFGNNGRRILNTYGPTETTVNATWSELLPGRKITIGRPLPTYRVLIVDSELQPVPDGEPGEIVIGGIGVARGYLNRDDLTREKFIFDPCGGPGGSPRPGVDNPYPPGHAGFHPSAGDTPPARFYRSGDLGRFTKNGEIEFLGRIDTQVKIRGYRIEPGEIESAILDNPAIKQAVVTTLSSPDYHRELIAYVVLRESNGNNGKNESVVSGLYEKLRLRLPSYMIPDIIEIIPSIPLLSSGKVDKSGLPQPGGRRSRSAKTYAPPNMPDESLVAAVWANVFNLAQVSVEDDFFFDLGGHSMFAALAVSALRKNPRFAHISMSDIYKNPTVRGLAGCALEAPETIFSGRLSGKDNPSGKDAVDTASSASSRSSFGSSSQASSGSSSRFSSLPDSVSTAGWRFSLCGTIQAAAIYSIVTIMALPIMLFLTCINSYYYYDSLLERGVLGVSLGLTGLMVMSFLLPIISKWLILGRVKPGSYPLWGSFYVRWWIVRKFHDISFVRLLTGSPLINVFARSMGARVGKGCYIGTAHLALYDMIEIGAGSSIGYDTHVPGYKIADGFLIIAPVKIGRDCMVGNKSIVQPGSVIEDGGRLGDQSLLQSDVTIPAGQCWSGSPARQDRFADKTIGNLSTGNLSTGGLSNLPPTVEADGGIAGYSGFNGVIALAGFVLGAIALALVPILAFLPGISLMLWIDQLYGGLWFLLASLPAGLLFVLSICLIVVTGKAILMPRVKPGIYKLDSWFYFRKWLTDKLVESSLLYTQSLYATLYVLPFLRLLGARVGKRAEVSTASHITPELLTIDNESFIADFAHVGTAKVYRGHILLAPTRIGSRSFVGNSAMLPAGYNMPDMSLLGVMSIPPNGEMASGSSWLGSPAMYLPRREVNTRFSINETFLPDVGLYARRLAYEFFRVTLPASLVFLASGIIINSSEIAGRFLSHGMMIFTVASLYFAANFTTTAMVVLLKKLLVGIYKPLERPLWSSFVWRSELITGIYENVTVPALLFFFTGTPFAAMILRLFGAHIGKRVFMDTTFITEFDLIHVEDDSSVGYASSLQTHLFEDRVMKMSHLWVGKNCSIGISSVVLYDSRMNDDVQLEALSLLMKGETLPPGTSWTGSPAVKSG